MSEKRAREIRRVYRVVYGRDPLARANRGDYRRFKKRYVQKLEV